MARTTKAMRDEALTLLRERLAVCGPEGAATLCIMWCGGRPTSTGRSDYYEIRVLESHREDGRPERSAWLNVLTSRALGLRLNDERVSMGGFGYNKALKLATSLASIAGHWLAVDLDRSNERRVEP